MTWKLNPNLPIYAQIIEKIQMDIVNGTYPPGSQLPSVRTMALEAGVNPNTIQRAMQELERTELVESRRTSGRFITDDQTRIVNLKQSIAKQDIQDFLRKMRALGFNNEEILSMISEEVTL